jgi:hypothetical protein
VKIAVVAHHSRFSNSLVTEFADKVFIDFGNRGALWNHRRALRWAMGQEDRVWIVEDDAIPCTDFIEALQEVVDDFPDNLVSAYLGTGRPVMFQEVIPKMLEQDPEFVMFPYLLHGICYSLPSKDVPRVVEWLDKIPVNVPVDLEIGLAYAGNVVYPIPSLVDHKDEARVELSTVPNNVVRKAWRFKG